MKTQPAYTRHNTLALQAWLSRSGLRIPKSYDDDEDDGLSHDERIQKVTSLMGKSNGIRKTMQDHCQEAIKSLRKACPEIEQAEINKFFDRVKAKGRAQVIDIEAIRRRARSRIGTN